MSPDYYKAVRASIDVLIDHNFNTLPINLDLIFKNLKRTINKSSYSDFANKSGLSIGDVCDYFESDLGACAYDRKRERYVIYYNDTKFNHGLDRFTIAHELGHVFLNHYDEIDSDILLRKTMPEEQYQRFENEASCFARNLLSPVPLVERVTDVESNLSLQELQDAFDISFLAANSRRKFYILDKYRINHRDYDYFNSYDIKFGYNCDNCGNADIEDLDYCKICGQEHRPFEKNHGKFYNDGIKTNENKRVIECPVCENEKFTKGLYYCKICGLERYNYCSHPDCGQPNDGNARYCRYCGSKTVYFNKGLLDKIK